MTKNCVNFISMEAEKEANVFLVIALNLTKLELFVKRKKLVSLRTGDFGSGTL